MKKFLICIVVSAFCVASAVFAAVDKPVVSMKLHQQNEMACADCHGTENPVKNAPASACISCHENLDGTYKGELDKDGVPMEKEYREGAGKKHTNFHDSHQGEIRCTLCHSYHKEPILYCNECHSFVVDVK